MGREPRSRMPHGVTPQKASEMNQKVKNCDLCERKMIEIEFDLDHGGRMSSSFGIRRHRYQLWYYHS